MPSCNTYRLTWVSLTLGVGISSQLLQQSTANAPYLGRGVFLTTALPDLQRGIAPLGPPVPAQPHHGVGPLCRRPWSPVWGCGVAPPAHHPGLGLKGVGYLLPAARPWPQGPIISSLTTSI